MKTLSEASLVIFHNNSLRSVSERETLKPCRVLAMWRIVLIIFIFFGEFNYKIEL